MKFGDTVALLRGARRGREKSSQHCVLASRTWSRVRVFLYVSGMWAATIAGFLYEINRSHGEFDVTVYVSQ